jgi:hypothetical protein
MNFACGLGMLIGSYNDRVATAHPKTTGRTFGTAELGGDTKNAAR